jgi:hypothetical protein
LRIHPPLTLFVFFTNLSTVSNKRLVPGFSVLPLSFKQLALFLLKATPLFLSSNPLNIRHIFYSMLMTSFLLLLVPPFFIKLFLPFFQNFP